MNSNQPEPRYGELREAVIEVILGAGDHGIDNFGTLLEKTALELAKRDGPSPGGRQTLRGPASPLQRSDPERVVEIVWELARQGIATFGSAAPNPSWPPLRRSCFGAYGLRGGQQGFQNDTWIMKAFRVEAADISADAIVYLREAVTAFYMDCLLSTCVMLGVAAEDEFLKLLRVAKDSRAHGSYFSRIGDGLDIGAKISQFREAIKPILTHLPKTATEELDHNLETIQSVIRAARNEKGQPSGALPPSRDQVYLYLQHFIPFAKQAKRLRRELNEHTGAQVVRLH